MQDIVFHAIRPRFIQVDIIIILKNDRQRCDLPKIHMRYKKFEAKHVSFPGYCVILVEDISRHMGLPSIRSLYHLLFFLTTLSVLQDHK